LGIVLLRVGGDGDGTEERHDERSHPNPHARVFGQGESVTSPCINV
jgi:hypothetical protein